MDSRVPANGESPPDKRSGPAVHRPTRTSLDDTPSLDDIPPHRPWAWRPDALDIEIRFRRDREGWRRRIDYARRSSHDANDPLAPYNDGCWTTAWARRSA